MVSATIAGVKLEVDEQGFMEDAQEWSETVATHLAMAENVEAMNEDHWKLVSYTRDYYERFGVIPPARMVFKRTGVNLKRVQELFPSGLKGLCRVSGLSSMQCQWWPNTK